MKTILRPPHQRTSKDVNQIEEKIGEKFDKDFGFGLHCDLSSEF